MNSLLNKLIEECRPFTNQGHVATYIPELANANADAIGICIVQDGKVIGAVTHVLVNDPTRGYGIFIEEMLETAE